MAAPSPTRPNAYPLRWAIRGLIAVGAVFVLFVLVSAAQRPGSGGASLEDLAARIDGVTLSLLPPPTPASLRPALQNGGPILVLVVPPRCRSCAADDLLPPLLDGRQIVIAAPDAWTRPEEGDVRIVPIASLPLGEEPSEPLIVLYEGGREIARGRAPDWDTQAATALLEGIRQAAPAP